MTGALILNQVSAFYGSAQILHEIDLGNGRRLHCQLVACGASMIPAARLPSPVTK